MYYRWSKAFLDAGKNGLTRDTQRDATTEEVRSLKEENATLKKALAESILETLYEFSYCGPDLWLAVEKTSFADLGFDLPFSGYCVPFAWPNCPDDLLSIYAIVDYPNLPAFPDSHPVPPFGWAG
jgi:hypothetical protein